MKNHRLSFGIAGLLGVLALGPTQLATLPGRLLGPVVRLGAWPASPLFSLGVAVRRGAEPLPGEEAAVALVRENERLSVEVQKLRRLYEDAVQRLAEQGPLRDRLLQEGRRRVTEVSARVTGTRGGGALPELLIDAGSRDAVEPDQPVVFEEAVVGRVVPPVSEGSARVAPLFGFASSLAVEIRSADGHAGCGPGSCPTPPRAASSRASSAAKPRSPRATPSGSTTTCCCRRPAASASAGLPW